MTLLHQEPNRSHVGLRPSRIELDLASGFTPPNDPEPVTWTTASKRLPIRQLRKFCDDEDRLTVASEGVVLPNGLWTVVFDVRITKTGTAADTLRLAITSAGGVVPLLISEQLTAEVANPSVMSVRLEAVLETPFAGLPMTVEFRAAQTSTGTDFTIEPESVGYIERFANFEQTNKS